MSVYLELTECFNERRLRAVISSGQAVVLHRLAVMSKDGDWILREDQETMTHVLTVLARFQAHYRFGAPLDVRWMAGGWSAHLEFRRDDLRVRTDFVTRPPRLAPVELQHLLLEQENRRIPFVNPRHLADLKKTNREKDYAVIGELARLMTDPRDQLMYSRSARDLTVLAGQHPDLVSRLTKERPLLAKISLGREVIEQALDAERRVLMRKNEERLALYLDAAQGWSQRWPEVSREIEGRPLLEAHQVLVRRADGCLPFALPEAPRG